MRQASKRIPDSAEKTVRDIRRATRRHHSAEEKIRIVLDPQASYAIVTDFFNGLLEENAMSDEREGTIRSVLNEARDQTADVADL